MLKNLILITGFLLLSACSFLSPVQTSPAHNYSLNAMPSIVSRKIPSKPLTILVATVQSVPAYDTTQIAYTTQPYQLAYFINSAWVATPAQMLQQLILQTLQDTRYFHAVIPPSINGHYDIALHVQLLQLQQDFLQRPSEVHLALRAQLVNINNEVIAAKQFSVTVPAPQDNPYGGVLAANQAVATVLQQLAAWVS
jgi:cholesterol transport system auxiliary component